MLVKAKHRGDLRTVRKVNAILAIAEGYSYSVTARILNVCKESVRLWISAFLLKGPKSINPSKSPGRPPKLTKTQRNQLDEIITNGPTAAGYPGACWRSPMIQHLIHEEFGVFYSVNYIAQLLKNMGFSYQKARFVSDHKDPEKRKEWSDKTWPEILKLAKHKDAYILFGDEASFPQWGTLTFTWAKRGQQPTVKTSGVRKGYKVFGLIDCFTGRFFHKAQDGRLTSESYSQFLLSVLTQSRKHIILVQDGARYHTSKAMQQFFEQHKQRLTVYQLPSYSPDYNPIEKLWKEIKKDGTHLHYFPTFQDLINKVEEVLAIFQGTPRKILSLFGMYHELSNNVSVTA
ncbi:MAG TPA: IS630 family transposase [Syntrophobacteraceae bacterium]|nr:IS630 family transposase [Syntrophobacteraceae bacterium]